MNTISKKLSIGLMVITLCASQMHAMQMETANIIKRQYKKSDISCSCITKACCMGLLLTVPAHAANCFYDSPQITAECPIANPCTWNAQYQSVHYMHEPSWHAVWDERLQEYVDVAACDNGDQKGSALHVLRRANDAWSIGKNYKEYAQECQELFEQEEDDDKRLTNNYVNLLFSQWYEGDIEKERESFVDCLERRDMRRKCRLAGINPKEKQD